MTDQTTPTEKLVMEGNRKRLGGIVEREKGTAARDGLFGVAVIVGIGVLVVLGAAAIWWQFFS